MKQLSYRGAVFMFVLTVVLAFIASVGLMLVANPPHPTILQTVGWIVIISTMFPLGIVWGWLSASPKSQKLIEKLMV